MGGLFTAIGLLNRIIHGKLGHMKHDCFQEGGGKDGQWPKHWKKDKGKEQANLADDDLAAWHVTETPDTEWEAMVQENLSGYVEPREDLENANEQLEGIHGIYFDDDYLWSKGDNKLTVTCGSSELEKNSSEICFLYNVDSKARESEDGNLMPNLQSISGSDADPIEWRTAEPDDDDRAWFHDFDS